jgi:hypothetical protein
MKSQSISEDSGFAPAMDKGREGYEPPEPRSVLGLPVRFLFAITSVVLPLLTIEAFASLHNWPLPPPCPAIAMFGCPSAPFPLAAQGLDWAYLAGSLLSIASAVTALRMSRHPGEAGLLIYRYTVPVVGLLVSVGCAAQLVSWVTQAGK